MGKKKGQILRKRERRKAWYLDVLWVPGAWRQLTEIGCGLRRV